MLTLGQTLSRLMMAWAPSEERSTPGAELSWRRRWNPDPSRRATEPDSGGCARRASAFPGRSLDTARELPFGADVASLEHNLDRNRFVHDHIGYTDALHSNNKRKGTIGCVDQPYSLICLRRLDATFISYA
jgi:hypothetical protein